MYKGWNVFASEDRFNLKQSLYSQLNIMLFKGFTVTILTLAAAIQVFAAPTVEAADDDLVVVQTLPYANGTLVVYGSAPGTVTAVSPQSPAPNCGTNAVTCSSSHTANINTCASLISGIQDSSALLASSPRALCLTQGGDQCCVSWSTDIGSVNESDLFSAAEAVFNECINDNLSGLARDVSINGQCLTECVSNRATGCS